MAGCLVLALAGCEHVGGTASGGERPAVGETGRQLEAYAALPRPSRDESFRQSLRLTYAPVALLTEAVPPGGWRALGLGGWRLGSFRWPWQRKLREADVPENPLKDAYFGDVHVHSSHSLDAFIAGNRHGPADAYAFAGGEALTINGVEHRLHRPLDFVVVTDHAEFAGEMWSAQQPNAPGYRHPAAAELRALKTAADRAAWLARWAGDADGVPRHLPFYEGPASEQRAWSAMRTDADHAYLPGQFSTLIGFEWSGTPGGANLHRSVIFRDTHVPERPANAIDEPGLTELWDWLAMARSRGMQAIAIPHNPNASMGRMFAATLAGQPMDAATAARRAAAEPLVEIVNAKGASEIHREFWLYDEFAEFENADSIQRFAGRAMSADDFVRWGVIKGLDYQERLGVNPFQTGFVGGTDNHNAAPGDTVEDDFIGAHGGEDGDALLRLKGAVTGWIYGKHINPGGLTGVWATRNIRPAIWDGLAAREVFATSGTRIKLRMFAGAALTAPADARAMAIQGYKAGVPMGGVLKGLVQAPAFTVWAQKDPDGANLDRIQIIKGWVDAKGDPQERVIDIVWAGKRRPGPSGKLPKVGDTVDLATARYTNSIGVPELLGYWRDPDWRPDQHAVYYARALEIPTPRWSTYDAVRNGRPLLTDVPPTVQERAWGSPIWYVAPPRAPAAVVASSARSGVAGH